MTGRGCCSIMSPTDWPRSVLAIRSLSGFAANSLMSAPAQKALLPAPVRMMAVTSAVVSSSSAFLSRTSVASSSALRRCSRLMVNVAIRPAIPTSSDSAIAVLRHHRSGEGQPGFLQVSTDQHLLDLVGSVEDLERLHIAHHPFDRIIAGQPVAAKDLDGIGGHA